ncbi:hypothetical protein MAM1_0130d06108 [Mucor ambiguus]|uniref:Uncharacterized protein n=1 Tax=Mucor ambiguus TaxID=91626 RepID=A0A0C9M8H8_9FUNG|nr:hypothetical protein MAM1_0130d06108 [Mucor ambiguus]
MSSLKRRRQDTSEVDSTNVLSSAQMNPTNEVPYDASYFPLPEARFPLGTPVQSKRSRKLYSDLADEREFLLHLKELWKSKLADLKEDKRLLEKMKDTKKHDVINEESLFCPEEEEGVEVHPKEDNMHDVISVNPPIVVESEDREDQPDSFKIVNGQVVVKDPSMLATLQELDKIYMDSHSAQQEPSSDEEEVAENDEDARQALHRMLEEFGGGF